MMIIKRKLIPFCIFIVTTAFYMQLQLEQEDQGLEQGWTWTNLVKKALGVTSTCFLFNEIFVEARQFKGLTKKMKYISNGWNWIDFFGLSLSLIFNIHTLAEMHEIPVETLRIMAAFATCAIFIKLYDWLRLFESTAFYVLLVKLTMKDILPFMILLFVSLLIFDIPMSMLSLNRDENSTLVDESFGFWLIDAVYN